ncbi:MAG: PfkB family carbohydrate kinase, partial [Oscillospiraceae bacterium]|nr:PfkB family carbohydrate kinase [Oscillospiraceae bacterium]
MKLAAVGSNCIDYYNNIDGGKAYPGGGPVNMAVYTLRLGGNASYIGPVGDDAYGKIMLDAIAAKGVDVSHLPEYKRAKYIGRVFQDPMMGTAATMQIEENLALAARRGNPRT